VAVGYPDPDSPVNQANSDRALLHEVARYY